LDQWANFTQYKELTKKATNIIIPFVTCYFGEFGFFCFCSDKEGTPINRKWRKRNENGCLKDESQISGIVQKETSEFLPLTNSTKLDRYFCSHRMTWASCTKLLGSIPAKFVVRVQIQFLFSPTIKGKGAGPNGRAV
jgi:hypothetical protein